MIEIKNLTKIFNENVYAVNNLTLNIDKGVNGLIGENGAGKSTLLRLIADVYEKNSGEILIDGKANDNPEVMDNLFFLSDSPFYSGNGTAKATMEFYSSLFKLDEKKFYAMMDKLSLPADRRIGTFSKGMRRQLFLCIALSMDAEYILLDEAFDGLDPIVQDVVKDEIIKNAENKTFIVSSHNLLSLERLCDNFILLSRGKCKKEGSHEDLGQNFRKYQIMFDQDITEENLKNIGVHLISFKKVGSIIYIVTTDVEDEKLIKETLKPKLMESVIIDNDEIIKLEMMLAKEGDE